MLSIALLVRVLYCFLRVTMPVQLSSQLSRLVRRDNRGQPRLDASVAPTASSLDNPNAEDNSDVPLEVLDDDDSAFDGLDWTRVPHLEKRGKDHVKGPPSWIYLYGWPVYHRVKRKNYWLCRYCHVNKNPGGEYSSGSTSGAAAHLAKRLKGHSVNISGPVTASVDPNQGTLIALMRENNVEVSQSVANRISASFGTRRFQDALIDWVATDNQSLRVVETPSFRHLIKAANPLAEAVLWRSHQSLRDAIVAEYHAYIPVVTAYLRNAQSLIHVSFDN